MELGFRLALGNAQPVGPASSITIDTAPAITGTAEVGETLTRTVGSYSGDGTITVSNGRWTRNGVDISPAQTGATYALDPADDQTTVRWYEDVADAGSGDTITAQSNGLYVTYTAPTAAGGLTDQSFTEDTGAQTYDVSGDFTNAAGGTWSLPTTIAGVTINSSGVVQVDTDTLALQTGTSIVARYTNSGGSADSGFSLTITEASSVATLSFDSAGPQETDGDVPISYTISANDTVELVLFAAAEADPDAADFDGGGAPTYIDLGPASLTTGGAAIDVSIPSDLSGSYKIAGLPSGGGDVDVAVSAAFTVDTVAPTISSSSPADNATGVAVDVSPAITFNENIQFGTGNIVLRENNGGWADLEVFDVASDIGGGAGTVSISGAVLTIEPTSDLSGSIEYAIRIASTAIQDDTGSPFAGIADDTTISFTTAAAATAPAAFTVGQWTAATGSGASEIDINITTLPSDGGSSITALQYSVDSGSTWANLTGTGTGSRTIDQHSDGSTGTLTASTSYNIEVRAVNAVGNGADSDTKATTTGAAASDPAGDILTLLGAKAKALYATTDFANMKQNTGGSTAVTAAGQAVRYLEDLSGNGNHSTAQSGNALSASGYLDWNDAEFIIAATGDFTSTSEVYALVDPADDADDFWNLLGVDGQSGIYLCVVQSGAGSAPSAGFTPSAVTVNNVVQSSPTRGTLHTAMTTGGGYKALGASGINLSNESQVRMPLSYDIPATVSFGGRAKLFLICDALTTGERSDLQDIFDGAK